MKVILVNTYDKGGAANSCIRLHKGLLGKAIDSKVLLRSKSKENLKTIQFQPTIASINLISKIKRKAQRILKEFKIRKRKVISEEEQFLNSREKGLEMFSFPNSNFDITQSIDYQEADIINLHWVANFLDYKSFFEKNRKPIVWTLHDMNPFTGGEHYSETYLSIDEDGFPKKRSLNELEKVIAAQNLDFKKQALEKVTNLTIVTPSEWLAQEAQKSELFQNYEAVCIPNGIDSSIYKPRDKTFSRDLFGLPLDKKVILFVADSVSNNRKGFYFLKEALKHINRDDVVLCAIGSSKEDLESLPNVVYLGSIAEENLMSAAYSAADVFVIPSLMDNLPNTVLESLMCGIPVIGFPIGGIPEMVQDGMNGFITNEISVNSLKEKIVDFLNQPKIFDSNEIRENAIKKYDLSIQAAKYQVLFAKILNK